MFTLIRRAAPALALIAAPPALAQTEPAPVTQIPEGGTATLRVEIFSGVCVVAQITTRALVTPYLRGGPCRDAIPINAEWLGQSRARLRIGNTNNCATVARGVVAGPARVDILPCDRSALDQEFRLAPDGDRYHIRTSEGTCWYLRASQDLPSSDMVLERCQGLRGTFRLYDLNRMLSVARPVGPMPVTPAVPKTIGPLPLVILPPAAARQPADGVYRIGGRFRSDVCLSTGLQNDRGNAPLRFTADCATGTQFNVRWRGKTDAGKDRFEIGLEGTSLCLMRPAGEGEGARARATFCGSDAAYWFEIAPADGGAYRIRQELCLMPWRLDDNQLSWGYCGSNINEQFVLRPR